MHSRLSSTLKPPKTLTKKVSKVGPFEIVYIILKSHRFLGGKLKTEALVNDAEKASYCTAMHQHMLFHASKFSGVLELVIGESMRFFSYENPLFRTGQNNPKTITLSVYVKE